MSIQQLFSTSGLDMFDILFRNPLNSSGYLPIDRMDYPIDIWYDDIGCNIEFALTDAKLDNLKITKTDDQLFVSYHPEKVDESKSKVYLQRKIKRSGFDRSFRIPSKLNLDSLESEYSNGLLRIGIPWAKSALPTEVKVLNKSTESTIAESN